MPAPALLWLRRELRLADNPALLAAIASGRPVLPVFILDEVTPGAWAPGGAARWWLHHSLAALADDLAARGATLTLRRGHIAEELPRLLRDTGAARNPCRHAARTLGARRRRRGSAAACRSTCTTPRTLFPPDAIRSGSGGAYGVFSAFARACLARDVAPPLPAPARIEAAAAARLRRAGLLAPAAAPAGLGGRAARRPGSRARRARGSGWTHFAADGARRLRHRARPSRPRRHVDAVAASALGRDLRRDRVARRGRRPARAAASWRNELLWREFSAHLLWHHPRPARAAAAARLRRDALAQRPRRRWRRGSAARPACRSSMPACASSGRSAGCTTGCA